MKEDPKARILAVTFTRKAAGEMQERLETLLKSSDTRSSNSKQQQQQQLQQQQIILSLSDGTSITEEEFSDGASSSPTYIRDLSRATLGTFHKICADILRYNGSYLAGLPSITHE